MLIILHLALFHVAALLTVILSSLILMTTHELGPASTWIYETLGFRKVGIFTLFEVSV